MSRVIIHNHLPRAKDAVGTGPELDKNGKPVAYGKYQAKQMGLDSYENGLTSKEDELIRQGYHKVSTGNLGWTKVYENAAGKRVTIEFGPQPGQIKSITKDAPGAVQYYLVSAWVTEPHWLAEHIARERLPAQSEEEALTKAKAKFANKGMNVNSVWIGS